MFKFEARVVSADGSSRSKHKYFFTFTDSKNIYFMFTSLKDGFNVGMFTKEELKSYKEDYSEYIELDEVGYVLLKEKMYRDILNMFEIYNCKYVTTTSNLKKEIMLEIKNFIVSELECI